MCWKASKEGFAPDPPAHLSEKQWVFDVTYDKGAMSIQSARSANAKKPMPTARVMGRFALELWIGRELLDRIRFDVPLLGDDEGERDPKHPTKRPRFSQVTAKLKVQMADHPRATVLKLVDRATNKTLTFFWPPDEKGALTPFSAKAATGAAVDGGSDAGDAGADADAGDAGVDGSSDGSVDAGSDAAMDAPVRDQGSGKRDGGR